MPKRDLPPFSAVRAFEAAARHLSFKRAADELCLSPSAISHQVRGLETYLATTLFHREGNRLTLSLTGAAYAGRITDLLDGIAASTAQVRGVAPNTLRILATPGFAARWLVPRLPRFAHAKAVRLRLAPAAPSTDFFSNDADVVIQWRDRETRDVTVWPFLSSSRYPAAAPGFAEREGIARPYDLLGTTLFRDETDDEWEAWFNACGVLDPPRAEGPIYPNCEYATTAAEAGLGVVMAYDAVVRSTLKAGRLVRLFDRDLAPATIYGIACAASRRNEPLIRDLRRWLMNESLRDGTLPDAPHKRRAALQG